MIATTKPIERFWYPLDGVWHPSVATKLSALHLSHPDHARAGRGGRKDLLVALCDPRKKMLYEGDQHTDDDARSSGRVVCARCQKAAEP